MPRKKLDKKRLYINPRKTGNTDIYGFSASGKKVFLATTLTSEAKLKLPSGKTDDQDIYATENRIASDISFLQNGYILKITEAPEKKETLEKYITDINYYFKNKQQIMREALAHNALSITQLLLNIIKNDQAEIPDSVLQEIKQILTITIDSID